MDLAAARCPVACSGTAGSQRRLEACQHHNSQPSALLESTMAGDLAVSSSSRDDTDMRDASSPLPPPPAPPIRPLFSISLVCQSNVNRSMEAHRVLADQGWPVALYSYGVGHSRCLTSHGSS